MVTVSPYLIRNFVIFEKITVIESSGYNLWKGNHPNALKNSRVEGSEMVNENLKKLNDAIPRDKFYRINRDKLFFDQAIQNIMGKPIEYIIFFLKKAISFQFIIMDSMDPRYWNPLNYLPILLLGITSLIGLVLSDKKSYKFNYLILIFFVIIIIFSMVSIMPRYKLVILPLQIIFTNIFIERIVKKYFLQREKN